MTTVAPPSEVVDAKNIYISQLAETIGPYILRTMDALFDETLEAGTSNVLLRFQSKLRQIPVWNSTLVDQHAVCLESKAPYLKDLIAATFVAYVKVMSSIKLRDDKSDIRLMLPTTAAFLHRAFINVAKDMYNIIQKTGRFSKDDIAGYQGMRTVVEQTIRDRMPIQDILKAYLGNTVDAARTVSPTLENDDQVDDDDDETQADHDDSPAMFPSPEESAPAASPVQQFAPAPAPYVPPAPPVVAPQPMEPQQPAQPVQPFAQVTECETKTISIPPAKEDGLFNDADDEATDWRR